MNKFNKSPCPQWLTVATDWINAKVIAWATPEGWDEPCVCCGVLKMLAVGAAIGAIAGVAIGFYLGRI